MGLTIFSYSPQGGDTSRQQIVNLVGDLVEVRTFSYAQLLTLNKQISDDLILITAGDRLTLFLQYVAPDTKYIVAKRIINPNSIKKVLEIDSGSKVLVVNHQTNNSIAMIAELRAMGINLDFTPYSPSQKREYDHQYAITPGYTELVPQEIPNIIDVGARYLSILTIAEILYHFTGEMDHDGLVFSRYIRDFIELSMEITDQNKENLALRLQLENIVARVESGILIADEKGEVVSANNVASFILEEKNLKGMLMDTLLPGLDNKQTVSFYEHNARTIHITTEYLNPNQESSPVMYIIKDLDTIRELDEQYRSYERNQGHVARYHFTEIIHSSVSLNNIIEKAKNFARTNSNVLIQGESGTGKELFAQAIHNSSKRASQPFIAVNCATIPESLLESELFGYEGGAFTGALRGGKRGFFEQAHTGTIFLDEIGDAPMSIQTKLLRVLQEKEIIRISGEKVIPVDIRIIAATNQNLLEKVNEGLFRQDLLFRLNVLPIIIPPLRDRIDDVEVLLRYYIHRHAKAAGLPIPELSKEIWNLLLSYTWPGNVREIMNIAEYIINTFRLETDLKTELESLLSTRNYFFDIGKRYVSPAEESMFINEEQFKDCLFLLKIISEKYDGFPPGRKALSEELKTIKYPLSEQQVKTRLELLRKQGYLRTSQGKKSRITEEGYIFLREHPEQRI